MGTTRKCAVKIEPTAYKAKFYVPKRVIRESPLRVFRTPIGTLGPYKPSRTPPPKPRCLVPIGYLAPPQELRVLKAGDS